MSAENCQPPARYPTVGVGVVIVRGDEIVLIKRGKAPRLGEWSIPGGTQELGETVRETAVREALEETGLHVGNLDLIDVVDAFGRHPDGTLRTQWTLVDFRAEYLGGDLCAGGDAAEARWVSIGAVADYGLWDETVRIIHAAAALRVSEKPGSPNSKPA